MIARPPAALAATSIILVFAGCPSSPAPVPLNPCNQVSCGDDAQCVDLGDGTADCICNDGFVETSNGTCLPATGLDACTPNPCTEPNKGVCATLQSGGFACACDAGYVENADGECVAGDPCDPNPCTDADKHVCTVGEDGTATCTCDPGFHDDGAGGCTSDACLPNPCDAPNKGVCTVGENGDATCSCDAGFHDDGAGGCTSDVCLPNPCVEPNRGVCAVGENGDPTCSCDPGFVDDDAGGCAPPVDPCDPNPCVALAKGVCTTDDGGVAICSCDPGFHDDGAGNCTDDPCLPNPCPAAVNGGVCSTDDEAQDGYVCGCQQGFYDDGTGACVDACSVSPPPCTEPNKTTCDPFGGVATCSCDPGFHDDGAGNCTDDPCLPNPCGVDEACAGSPGSGTFVCAPCIDGDGDGYGVGDGCVDLDCDDADPGLTIGCVCLQAHDGGDALEPDECFFSATTATPGDTQPHTIGPPADVDWVVFAAQQGDIVYITVSGATAELELTLIGRDGVLEIATIKTDPVTGEVTLGWQIPEDGEWFIRVRGGDDAVTSPYDLTVVLADNDHGSDRDSATLLVTDSTPTAGVLEVKDNADWFAFPVGDNHGYQLRAASGDTGLVLELWSLDGAAPIESATAPAGSEAFIDRGDLSQGTYYLRVRAYGNAAGTGTYTVWATDLGPDDHGDTPDDATVLADAVGSVNGSFEVEGNVDWFAIPVTEGAPGVSVTCVAPDTGCRVAVFTAGGTQLGQAQATYASEAAVTVPVGAEDAMLYVRVRPYIGAAGVGSYTMGYLSL